MIAASAVILVSLFHPVKIQSVKCVSAHACTITLNHKVSKDTPVYVKLKSGSSFMLTVRRGTRDVAFAFSSDIAYGSSSLKQK